MYDLIVLKSVCTVIQEYCRRKYCVLISYDFEVGRVDQDYTEEIKKWKIHLFIRNTSMFLVFSNFKIVYLIQIAILIFTVASSRSGEGDDPKLFVSSCTG